MGPLTMVKTIINRAANFLVYKPVDCLVVQPVSCAVDFTITLFLVPPIIVAIVARNIYTKATEDGPASGKLYNCTICSKLMTCCHAVTPCGDCFCYTCIIEWGENNKNCPCCGGNLNINKLLQINYVDEIISERIKSAAISVRVEWECRATAGFEKKRLTILNAPLLRGDLHEVQPTSVRRLSKVPAEREQGVNFVSPLVCMPTSSEFNAQVVV